MRRTSISASTVIHNRQSSPEDHFKAYTYGIPVLIRSILPISAASDGCDSLIYSLVRFQGLMSIIVTSLLVVCYPFILLAKGLPSLLLFIAAPILHVVHYLLYALWWPFHFTAKFETLYIYFSVAILVGIFAGASLHYSTTYIVTSLKLDASTEEGGRTLATYRAEKAERRARKARQLLANVGGLRPIQDGSIREQHSERSKQNRGLSTKGLLSTTIIEEDDSSEAGF